MFPLVSMVEIGQSAEGRPIKGIRIGMASDKEMRRRSHGRVNEPIETILITGGAHAREWISTSTVTYLAWSFISIYGKFDIISDLLDYFEVILVPVVNPDGY